MPLKLRNEYPQWETEAWAYGRVVDAHQAWLTELTAVLQVAWVVSVVQAAGYLAENFLTIDVPTQVKLLYVEPPSPPGADVDVWICGKTLPGAEGVAPPRVPPRPPPGESASMGTRLPAEEAAPEELSMASRASRG